MKPFKPEREQLLTAGKLIGSAVLCAVAVCLPDASAAAVIFFILAYLLAGYEVLLGAIKNMLHLQFFDEEFLMTVATAGALAIGEFAEAAAVMIFYGLGEFLQELAQDKSKRSISQLVQLRPDTATLWINGTEKQIPAKDIRAGDVLLIKPGEKIPVDGTVLEGSASVDTAALTGESLSCEKSAGDKVISGCIDLSGVIKLRAEACLAESTVTKILELVESSAEKKAKTERFITRFSRVYTPCVVVCAILIAVIPVMLAPAMWQTWLKKALIFLVVSCPCALVVSVPMAFFSGMGGASRHGILVKGANSLEKLAKVDTVVFDKTGTLTEGTFAVDAVHPSAVTAQQMLDIAAAVESFSNHPLARSVVAAHSGSVDSSIEDIEEKPGLGVKACIDGKNYYVGNASLMQSAGVDSRSCHLPGTVIHLCTEDEYLGHIVVKDRVKENAAAAIMQLRSLGIKRTVMLTGDKTSVAEEVARQVGVDEYYAQLLPDGKVEKLEKIIAGGSVTAFVGDGINDAPVLMRADVGIAMGAMGSDAAIESADIVLMDDDTQKTVRAIKTAKKTVRIAKENIWLSLGVKVAVLVLAAVGPMNMRAAVFADVGVTVLAVMNALRAIK